jgi:8-oxo-dGTP pyrophosphatase MutT (NUDIX family)
MRSSGPGGAAEQLRSSGAWLGVSWLVRLRDEGFVLAVKPSATAVEISAIGGKVESGERFREAAVPEYSEETGCPPPQMIDVGTPALFGLDAAPGNTEGACAFIRKRAEDPEGGEHVLWIAVFLGVASEDPTPVETTELLPTRWTRTRIRDRADG